MLDREEREKVEKLLEDVRRYKARRNFPRITTDDFEWLAEKLLEEDDLSSKLYEELQAANEELARRAEFD